MYCGQVCAQPPAAAGAAPTQVPPQRNSGPLAPALYQALREAFGTIRVGKAGELAEFRTVMGLHGLEYRMESPGELYFFKCPWCHDHRPRAWVSHMWGQLDNTGRPMKALIGCWNEDCFRKDPGRKHDFEMLLLGAAVTGPIGQIDRSRGVPGPSGPARLPGPVAPLSAVPEACRYLLARGFDPAYVSEHYGVTYCTDVDEPGMDRALGRIVIPIRREGKLIGWQARRIDGRDKFMKYYTMPGMKLGTAIYNWDRLCQSDTVTLCEGPMDVWAVGDNAGAIFGQTLKDGQLALLHSLRDRQPIVVLLFDVGAAEGGISRAREMLSPVFPGRVVVASLPAIADLTQADTRVWPVTKVDPGVLTQDAVAHVVQHAIQQQLQPDR